MPQSTKTAKIQSIGRLDDGRWRIILQPDTFPISVLNNRQVSYGTVNTSSVILDPYINTPNFENSNFNAVIGNATDIREGTLYQDVDYSTNATTPVNFDQIISGSATKATVPDSNYSTKRITRPRYEGSRSETALDTSFNSPTTNGGLGVLPNVEQDRTYFAYFNWVGGTAPEWGNGLVDRSALSVRYFIDSDGNVIEPTNDSNGVNLSITRQTFTDGETAVLSFDDTQGTSSNFSNLLGDQIIFKSGKTIAPIIYSQTESISSNSAGGYANSLTFGQGDQQENTAIDDYRLRAFVTQLSQGFTADDTDVEFEFEQYLGDSGSFSSDTTYSNTSTGAGDQPNELGMTITYKAAFIPEPNTGIGAYNVGSLVTFQFQKNGVYVGSSVQVDWDQPSAVFLTYNDNDIDSSDSVKLVAKTVLLAGSGPSSIPFLSNSSFFKVFQTPPPGIGDVGPGVSSTDYWIKGGNKNQPGSERIQPRALGPVYGQKQEDISGSGFFGITHDFLLQVGDEFRFQGTETQTYTIVEVDESTTPPTFVVDRYVNISNTEMDWFLVRRYIDNPSNIIIEADKPAGGTSPGFFMPLYATKGIEDNFDTIIQKLKTEQLI